MKNGNHCVITTKITIFKKKKKKTGQTILG